jgi:hypothetical protein
MIFIFKRELYATNIELRSQVQILESKLLENGSSSQLEKRDLVYRHVVEKDEKNRRLETDMKFLNDEIEKIRNALSFNSSKLVEQEQLRKPKKSLLPKKVLSGKEGAIGVIIHEVRRLREGFSSLKKSNEQVSHEVLLLNQC